MSNTTTTTVNKSQMIRDLIAAHPLWQPKQIADHMAMQGISVTNQYVSTIKFNMQINGKRSNAGERLARGIQSLTSNLSTAGSEFVRSAGGLEQAIQILVTAQQLKEIA